MRRKHPLEVECPGDLVRFDPVDWPAPSPLAAWQHWMHARADFADVNGLEHDAIPYEMDSDVWAVVGGSIS